MVDISRVQKELTECNRDREVSGVSIALHDGANISHLTGTIAGPADSPYEGGTFVIDIRLPGEQPADLSSPDSSAPAPSSIGSPSLSFVCPTRLSLLARAGSHSTHPGDSWAIAVTRDWFSRVVVYGGLGFAACYLRDVWLIPDSGLGYGFTFVGRIAVCGFTFALLCSKAPYLRRQMYPSVPSLHVHFSLSDGMQIISYVTLLLELNVLCKVMC